jgi:hypothetical protein
MAMSISTTSMPPARTRAIASGPLAASPASDDVAASARICLMPWRTIWWSSQISTRIMRPAAVGLVQRHHQPHSRALAGGAVDRQLAAEVPARSRMPITP